MKTVARPVPVLPAAIAAALLTAFLLLCAPLSASAHDSILSSSPEADETVQTLPAELTLTFSAKLIDGEGATEVVVTDAEGRSVTEGPATVNGAIVTQPLADEAEAGAYEVTWKVVSSDGHPTSGTYSFIVAESTAVAPVVEPTTSATEEALPTTAPETTPAETADDSDASEPAGDATAIWLLGALGVLALAALLLVLFSRRGNRERGDSDAIG